MVRLRLRRTGGRRKASFRVVAADKRSARDGSFIENLGYYDPRHDDEKVDIERIEYWLQQGAQPSDTVAAIIKRARGEAPPLTPSEPTPGKTASASVEAKSDDTAETPAADKAEAKSDDKAETPAADKAEAKADDKSETPAADKAEAKSDDKAEEITDGDAQKDGAKE